MSRSAAQTCAFGVVAILMLAACGEGTDEIPDRAGGEAGAPTAPQGDGAAPTPTVEEVFAEIAALGLDYEERLEYLAERAVEEGAVLLYGSPNLEVLEGWGTGFQEAYPDINYLYVRQRSSDLHQRVLAEARSGRHLVDVIAANATIGAALHSEGVIAEHHGVTVPEPYPEQYVEDWSVVSTLNVHVIAWNTNAITDEDAPRAWDDFLEPDHSGCTIDVTPTTFIATLILERGYDGAEQWLQAFVENGGVIREGMSQTTRAMAGGEIDCAVFLYAYDVEGLIAEGAPLAWHAAEPAPASAVSLYVYNDTQRPHAAALLMHWILARDGAQVAASEGRIAVHPEAEISLDRLQPFIVPGSDMQNRLLPVMASSALEVEEQALELAETHLVNRLVVD